MVLLATIVILLAIFVIFYLIKIFLIREDNIADYISTGIVSTLLILILIAGIVGQIHTKIYSQWSDWYVVSSNKIVSIGNGDSLNGDYFLIGGTVQSKMKYKYLIEVSPNNYRYEEISADKVTIVITDDGNYRIEKLEREKRAFMDIRTETDYKIYIPEDAIYFNMTIDVTN